MRARRPTRIVSSIVFAVGILFPWSGFGGPAARPRGDVPQPIGTSAGAATPTAARVQADAVRAPSTPSRGVDLRAAASHPWSQVSLSEPFAWTRLIAGPALRPGFLLTLDPRTGDVVQPTAEQVLLLEAQLEAIVPAAEDVPLWVTRPDGSVGARPGRRLTSPLVAHIGADGKIHFDCGHRTFPTRSARGVAAAAPEE